MAKKRRDKQAEAKWLTAQMEARGLSPKDLATKTLLDANWISQWKGASRGMTDVGMLRIARYFGENPYTFRPYLKDFEDFFMEGSPLLDGLSERSRTLVLNTIKHFKEQDAAAEATSKPFRPPEPDKTSTKKRKAK